MVPAAIFSAATTTLDKLGLSSERSVERAGLPQYQFLDPGMKIPGVHLYRLYGRASRELGEEAFGALVPDWLPIAALSGFGKAVTGSPTVYTAIDTISRLYTRASSVARFWSAEGDEGIWWLRKSALRPCIGSRQLELASLAYMIQLIRIGAESDWRPARICVEHHPVPHLERLEPFAGAEVLRERGVSGVAIPRSVLSRLMPFPAPTEPVEADRFYADAPSDEFVVSLRQVLRSLVQLGYPGVETAAEIGGVHVRTLQRRLRAEGLSFKKIVDQCRFLEAVDLMREREARLVEIAHDLGYSDQAHFNRAFRRWAGVTPSLYRSQLHSR